MKKDITGRGMFIWNLGKTENGNIQAILDKCKECDISWVAVKAGDHGKAWSQFSDGLVYSFHLHNIPVLGWSYDVPEKVKEQVQVVKRVYELGGDGFLIDAEEPWDSGKDEFAKQYMDGIHSAFDTSSFLLGDCPWDVVSYHSDFPFTKFGEQLDFRAPQCYAVAHKLSVEKSFERYVESWKRYEAAKPQAKRPHLPAIGLWGNTTAADAAKYEELATKHGMKGVLGWVWESVPQEIWDFYKKNPFPKENS